MYPFEQLFSRRFIEGYDLHDDEYISWLRMNHPDALPGVQPLEESTKQPTESSMPGPSLSTEKFNRRFSEGYDLYDEEYTSWLSVNHPDAFPKEHSQLMDFFPDVQSVAPVSSKCD